MSLSGSILWPIDGRPRAAPTRVSAPARFPRLVRTVRLEVGWFRLGAKRTTIGRAKERTTASREGSDETFYEIAGAGRVRVDRVDVAVEAAEETLLRVNEALEILQSQDPQAAQLVRLRFFVGLGYQEAAELLGISERTAKRDWAFARAWLYRELSRS